jgi:cytidylate kinase
MAVVTISRQYGAGAINISRMAADRLGYRLVDREILEKIAEKANVAHDWVSFREKFAGNKLMGLLDEMASTSFLTRNLPQVSSKFDDKTYRRMLTQVISEIARTGNLIIQGRGGFFILRDQPDAYHVCLVASEAERVQILKDEYQFKQTTAEKIAGVEEKNRIRFLQGYGLENPNDPVHYHLTLNTGRVSHKKAVDLICGLVQ